MRNEARAFAIKAHGDQMYGEFPYHVHLDEVAKIASNFGEKAEVVAFLHDVIEDTPVTEDEIDANFGSLVARCVSILSDEPGDTRKIRKAATYKKMAMVKGDEELALLVKAADRLANMRSCVRSKKTDFLSMYITENKVFKEAAYRAGLCDELWKEINEIERLATL